MFVKEKYNRNTLTVPRGKYETYKNVIRYREEEYYTWRVMNPNDMSASYKNIIPREGALFVVTDRRELRIADGIHNFLDCPIYCSGEEFDRLMNYHDTLSKQIVELEDECKELEYLYIKFDSIKIETRVMEVLIFIMIILIGFSLL